MPLRPATKMYFCFIVEEQYRHDSMPMVIAERLLQWGHSVDLLEPSETGFCPDSCRKVKGVFSREAVENKAGISSLEVSARGGYAMRKTSTAMDLRQEEANPWRESLEQRLRERMRELIEQVLEEEVEEALGAPRSQRAATRSGYRHGVKPRRLVLRGG